MRTRIFCCVCIFGFLLLGISNGVMAHGKPVITLASDTVKAGGQMTIKGTKMHPGVIYKIILESMEGSTPLGRAKVNKDGGFSAQFTLSANVAAGSHKVRAVGKEGESTLLNLTVLPRPQTTNKNPVQMMTNSGSQVKIDRKNSAVVADSTVIERQ